MAEFLIAKEKPDDPPWRPMPADFSLMHELVAQVRDLLGDVAALLADMPVGVKTRHKPPPKFLRPMTELDKARAKARDEADKAYDDRLLTLVAEGQRRWREQHPKGA